MILDTTNCKCHSLNHTSNGTTVPKLLLQLSRKKMRKKKEKNSWLPVYYLFVIKSLKKGNSVGKKNNTLCKAPFTKQMHFCIIFFFLFSLPLRSKALSTCKQSQATARNQSQHQQWPIAYRQKPPNSSWFVFCDFKLVQREALVPQTTFE